MSQTRNASKKVLLVASLTVISIFSSVKDAKAFFVKTGGDNTFSVVDLPVNGFNASFAIDTELNYSTIDVASANAFGLTDTGIIYDTGSSSIFEASLSSGSILINGIERPLEFAVLDEPGLPSGVTGRLGIDFLGKTKETKAVIDLKNLILTINPDFPITMIGDSPIVEIPVKGSSGTETLKFLVDTGAQSTTISTADSTKIGLTDTGKSVELSGAGSGISPVKFGQLNNLGTANFVISDSLKKNLPPGVTGVLGLNVIKTAKGIPNFKTLVLTLDPLPPSTPPNRPEEFPIRLVTTKSVPEPLTILGSATAAGFGAFFKRKRKLSESSEKDKIKAS